MLLFDKISFIIYKYKIITISIFCILLQNFNVHFVIIGLSKTTFWGKTNFSSSFKKKSMIIPNVEEKLLSKFKTQRSSVITENKDIIKRNKLLEKEIRFNKNDRFHWYQKQIEGCMIACINGY